MSEKYETHNCDKRLLDCWLADVEFDEYIKELVSDWITRRPFVESGWEEEQ